MVHARPSSLLSEKKGTEAVVFHSKEVFQVHDFDTPKRPKIELKCFMRNFISAIHTQELFKVNLFKDRLLKKQTTLF